MPSMPSMPHLVIVAWRPGLWHGLKEGCQMPRNQNMHRAHPWCFALQPRLAQKARTSTLNPVQFLNQSVPTKSSTHVFFLGNFKEVFEAHQSMHPKIPEATKHQRRDHPNSGPKYKLERPPATSHPSPSIHPMSGKIERIKHQRTKNQEKVSCIYIYTKKHIYI